MFRIGLCQFASGPDKARNIAKAVQMVQQAVTQQAQVVMLPQCFNAPYSTSCFRDYAQSSQDPSSPTISALSNLASSHNIFLIGGSIPQIQGEKIFNTSFSFGPNGTLLGKHRKVHLFDIDIPGKVTFFQSDVLSPGDTPTVIETDYCKFGLGICYDVRFAQYAWALAKNQEVGLLAYPGNFNTTTGPLHWELLMRARAADNQVFVAACSQSLDREAGYNAYGHSMVVDPKGKVVGQLGEEEGILMVDIDQGLVAEARNQVWSRRHKRFEVYSK